MPDSITQGRETIRLPFIGSPEERPFITAGPANTKDQRFVNVFFEPILDPVTKHVNFYACKRPGLTLINQPSGSTGSGRALYRWKSRTYSVIDNKIYDGTTPIKTIGTSTGFCQFAETRPGAATEYLCLNDGSGNLYCISTTDVVTTVVLPVANTGDLVYMDTYLFIIDAQCNIYNCASDDPTTWSGTSKITAQMMNGIGRGLAKQNNYLIAFSDRHFQVFYNATNSPGSPLTNVEQGMQRIGIISNFTLRQIEDTLFWVGKTQAGGYTAWKMEGTSTATPIGCPALDRVLNSSLTMFTNGPVACAFRSLGHLFYSIGINQNSGTAYRNFVWEASTGMWTEWTDRLGTGLWPVGFVIDQSVDGTEEASYPTGLGYTDGNLYKIGTSFQDNSQSFTVQCSFSPFDGGTKKRKFFSRMDLICDSADSTSTNNVLVQYSDNDGTSFSSGITLDISQPRAFQMALGNSRRRTWLVTQQNDQPFRAIGIEFDIELANG